MKIWFEFGSSAVLAAALLAGAAPVEAQSADPTFVLASRSAIVVLGTVARVAASEEPLLSPTPSTAVIKIRRMFAGSEFAGDQAGRTATVILSKPGSVKAGTQAFFFGNPRFIGKTLTIADEGELPVTSGAENGVPPELARGLQARRDAPIRARLAIADMVFRGTVESVRPLEATEASDTNRPNGQARELRDEHDPDWQVAQVRVTSAVRGAQNGALVPVVFPASRDIVWFKSPKLRTGEEVLVLGHRPQEEELPLLRTTGVLRFIEEQRAVLVTQPFDVLPPADEKRVIELLRTKGVQ